MMTSDTITAGSTTKWTLVRHRDTDRRLQDTWTFRTTASIIDIQVFYNGAVKQDKYAHGYYPTAEARTLWDQLVMDKGYEYND